MRTICMNLKMSHFDLPLPNEDITAPLGNSHVTATCCKWKIAMLRRDNLDALRRASILIIELITVQKDVSILGANVTHKYGLRGDCLPFPTKWNVLAMCSSRSTGAIVVRTVDRNDIEHRGLTWA
ncbi:hypothetical protein ACJ73_03370 [Blastomyces percursus]|uniref:Uncharacterized protein n=1 Tax=Blastomyces percursus TaxID=1658174 RepID=A0A1J9Q9R5_9EURO|nr:hypothetical protein ACJ73_03370 [Blastomyces percursus]